MVHCGQTTEFQGLSTLSPVINKASQPLYIRNNCELMYEREIKKLNHPTMRSAVYHPLVKLSVLKCYTSTVILWHYVDKTIIIDYHCICLNVNKLFLCNAILRFASKS